MYGEEFFTQAFVYLTAAVISVPIAKRLGLGSVLGYLLAGVAIGPFALDLIRGDNSSVLHFAEFGVVMMLFVIGLELRPSLLWKMRGPILGLGGVQIGITAGAIAAVGLALGQDWRVALAVGMILALSSTAIVLQTLNEKGLMSTTGGQSSFAVLLAQDIAVIPMLALLPLLAAPHQASDPGHGAVDGHATAEATNWVSGLPAWGQTLMVLAAVAVIVIAGRFLIKPVFRAIARTRLRELFTAAALLWVIGIALLMTRVGLSPALGTFLAGVVLADSEFRHELESDIEPFKGLLLGLFFIAVGCSIDFGLIASRPGTVAGLVLGLVVLKFLVLAILGRVSGMAMDPTLLFSFALAQGGEFGFVLFSFATAQGVLERPIADVLVVTVALSMALTPMLMLLNEKLIQPRFGTKEAPGREADAMDEDNRVIIAGYGRFGHIVGRMLASNGVECTVLDDDPDQVDVLRSLGLKVFYGDATRHDLLHAAGADTAELIVLAIDDSDRVLTMVATVRKHFPQLKIFARARGRADAYELIDAGVAHIYRETLDTSLEMGVDLMRELGFGAYFAQRAARIFRRHDEAAVREMAAMRHDRAAYIRRGRQRIRDLETCMRKDLDARSIDADSAWDDRSLRKEFGKPR